MSLRVCARARGGITVEVALSWLQVTKAVSGEADDDRIAGGTHHVPVRRHPNILWGTAPTPHGHPF